MSEINVVTQCTECGRTWDEDGRVQMSSSCVYEIDEFICSVCLEDLEIGGWLNIMV